MSLFEDELWDTVVKTKFPKDVELYEELITTFENRVKTVKELKSSQVYCNWQEFHENMKYL